MNKKLQSKDEKKAGEWEKSFDGKFTQSNVREIYWRPALPSTDGMPNYDYCKPKDVKAFIHSLLIQSRKEWQEEQNKVANSGRKLFQEGQKAERERIIGEVEKLDEIATINTPTPYDVGDFHLVRKADILHILKGEI